MKKVSLILSLILVLVAVLGLTACNKTCKHDDPTEIVVVKDEKPTCQKTGLTEGMKCNLCGTMVVPQVSVKTIGCIAGDWIVDKEATHTEDGKRHSECKMCGELVSENVILSGNKKLKYSLLDDNSYSVVGIGTCTDVNIVIPRTYDDKPVSRIDCDAFALCKSLKSIMIPDSVTSIGDGAFTLCKSLTNITIPNSVTSIGDFAFNQCTSLTNVIIPDSMTTVNFSAFYCCTSLTSITIPDSVTNIGNCVFVGCTSLTSIYFEGTVEQWNAITFGTRWNSDVPATEVICSDGVVSLN